MNRRLSIVILLLIFLTACGGGGGDGDGDGPPAGSSNWDQMVWDHDDWA